MFKFVRSLMLLSFLAAGSALAADQAFEQAVFDALQKQGFTITYDWTTHGSVRHTSTERLCEVAHKDFQGILDADFVLVLLPGGKGTHAELGFSIASKKRVFIHSEDPKAFEIGPDACAFYHHGDVTRLRCPIPDLAKGLAGILAANV